MDDAIHDLMEGKIDQITASIAAGCSEEEFRQLRCPVCDSVLELRVQPGLGVCTAMCRQPMHLRWHIRPRQEAPAWWGKYVVVAPAAPRVVKKR
jgi:hypothetical protein